MPENSFPFAWGDCWKQCVEYSVADFEAERDFFAETLGCPTNALSESYVMFTTFDRACFWSFVAASPERPATPPGSIKIQFMVADVLACQRELERRHVRMERPCAPYECEGKVYPELYRGTLRTPAGVAVDIWGVVSKPETPFPFA